MPYFLLQVVASHWYFKCFSLLVKSASSTDKQPHHGNPNSSSLAGDLSAVSPVAHPGSHTVNFVSISHWKYSDVNDSRENLSWELHLMVQMIYVAASEPFVFIDRSCLFFLCQTHKVFLKLWCRLPLRG